VTLNTGTARNGALPVILKREKFAEPAVDLDLALRVLRSLKFFLEAGQNSVQDARRACCHDAEQRSAQSIQVFSGRSGQLAWRLRRILKGRAIVAVAIGGRPLRMNFRWSSQRAE
jgi:hypothetical protein